MPDYGESPDLIEMRAKLAAARKKPSDMLGMRRRRELREIHEAYRQLFYPDGLTLSREGAIVLDDLAEAAGLGAASQVLDHAELCVLEGKRRLMLHLLSRFRRTAEEIRKDLEKTR